MRLGSSLLRLPLAALLVAPGHADVPGSKVAPPHAEPLRLLEIPDARSLPKAERAAVFEQYVLAYRAAVEARDEARARELAERATLVYPDLRRPWLHLAAARLRLEQWGPAIEAARRAEVARDDVYPPPASPDEAPAAAAYWEGVALYRTQRYDEALVRLRAARDRAPGWAEAARALGEAEFVARHPQESAAAYAAAFDLDPAAGTSQDLSYFAEARADGGDLDGGIGAMQEAVRREALAAGLHAKLGDLLRRAGQLAEAYYELVLEVLLQGVGGTFSASAVEMADAIVKQVREQKEGSDRHELLVVSSGLQSLEAGDPHTAIHRLAHVLTITRSASPVPRLLLADAYLRDGKPETARVVLEEILVAEPDFVPALYALSEVQAKLGKPADADRDLERVRALYPGYWKLHEKLGRR